MNHEYFTSFKWAIPLSFSDALAYCEFAKGDILYDSPCAYEKKWGDAIYNIDHSIHVVNSFKSKNKTTDHDAEKRFQTNWNSEILINLTDCKHKKNKQLQTTQGKLYLTLWKGGTAHLYASNHPKIPHTFSQLHKNLEKIKILRTHKATFTMAFDLTNRALSTKKSKIENEFKGKASLKIYSHKDISLELKKDFLPTVQLLCFSFDIETEKIERALKDLFYTPSIDKKTNREQFRLRSHGLLLPATSP